MSTGVLDDLQTSLGETDPSTTDGLSGSGSSQPHEFAPDWELDEVTGLVQNTSGPYCPGSQIEVEMTFSGEGPNFSRLKIREGAYTVNTAQNCSLAGKTPPTLTFTVDSGVGDTTGNVIGVTFDNVFNTATGVGTEFQTTFSTVAYDVTCDSYTYDSTNDDVSITYTIECGNADYNVDLYRDNDGTPALAAEQTQTSTGQYTITDTSPNSGGTSDEYRVDVTDSGGGGTTVCTITVQFPS